MAAAVASDAAVAASGVAEVASAVETVGTAAEAFVETVGHLEEPFPWAPFLAACLGSFAIAPACFATVAFVAATVDSSFGLEVVHMEIGSTWFCCVVKRKAESIHRAVTEESEKAINQANKQTNKHNDTNER